MSQCEYSVIDYMSGLTAYVLDEAIFKSIALERGVLDKGAGELTQRERDLLEADILRRVYLGPETMPSFSRQHGQFSTTTGQQTIQRRERLLDRIRALYGKWDDPALDSLEQGTLTWME